MGLTFFIKLYHLIYSFYNKPNKNVKTEIFMMLLNYGLETDELYLMAMLQQNYANDFIKSIEYLAFKNNICFSQLRKLSNTEQLALAAYCYENDEINYDDFDKFIVYQTKILQKQKEEE